MDAIPESITRDGESAIVIRWSDGKTTRWTAAKLRAVCPCATCREKKRGKANAPAMLPVLSAAEAKPLSIVSMRPVGSYAYNIGFSDGHGSGLFQFSMLHESES
ncbi:DUF971 domain-containing protein [Stieleria sp. JC731]|uniref:DUF971 domain-containing protein n=1 Tax=Pirellulaceae TaxID=2691357 RepID=UPI001E55A5CB|nr:DUF971 domain-containing protein [Stieleria sp. JC731]MCC9600857.1 DUF971 domain-containing protein [Stieleria sp. JC731]